MDIIDDLFKSGKKRKIFDWKSGMRFGRLVYTGRTYTKRFHSYWKRFVECVCDCGEIRDFNFSSIARGDTQSCGCFRRDNTRQMATTHGLTQHPLYDVWNKMIERCYKETDKGFKNYGARGIEVWVEWKNDFMSFYNWSIDNGWEKGLSLERINNDGNYAPYNCKYCTVAEQNRNRRNTRNYTAFGETKCLFDWGKDPRCKVGIWTLVGRLKLDEWKDDFEKAMTTPPLNGKEKSNRNSKTKMLTVFGETKTMTDWAKDERCQVGFDRLRDRVAEGWDDVEAVTVKNVDKREIILTAFGETKSLAEWSKDERCVVKIETMRERFRNGKSHEYCISEPLKTWVK